MRSHSAAQARQASAHFWQWSIWCWPHSSAQALQISTQRRQKACAWSLPRAIKEAATRQICAQSMSRAIQRAIAFTSSSLRHAAEQKSQASAQVLQASMQLWKFIWSMMFSFMKKVGLTTEAVNERRTSVHSGWFEATHDDKRALTGVGRELSKQHIEHIVYQGS